MAGTSTYVIDVTTANEKYAGTDATVTMMMEGAKGLSNVFKLDESNTHMNKFEKDQTDQFVITCGRVGKLKQITVEIHTLGVIFSDWKLEKIEVGDLKSNKTYTFMHNGWLGKKCSTATLSVASCRKGTNAIVKKPNRMQIAFGTIGAIGTVVSVGVTTIVKAVANNA